MACPSRRSIAQRIRHALDVAHPGYETKVRVGTAYDRPDSTPRIHVNIFTNAPESEHEAIRAAVFAVDPLFIHYVSIW